MKDDSYLGNRFFQPC